MSAIERIEITKPKSGTNTGTVIFLHGSGGTGQSVKEWIDMLRENETFSHLKILYPTASMRPYTPLKGEISNVWFDRLQISPNCTEHLESLNPMCEELKKLIDQEVKEGIPLNRIVIDSTQQLSSKKKLSQNDVLLEVMNDFKNDVFTIKEVEKLVKEWKT
ncbi:hypothetical protein PGB90_002225 [Kerria lacca]